VAAQVSTASGQVIRLTEGSQLVFGRGPEVDLAISAGRGLSRRAGVIAATPDGAWIANISLTHALYVAGEGYRIRLPRVEGDADPAGGWLVQAGTAMVGSRSMLDDGTQIAVTVAGRHRRSRPPADAQAQADGDGDGTVLPLYLDPKTKLFLVALMWCRPWLTDPSAASPLPRTPEIARAALEVTGAHHELERFEEDPEFRDKLAARVAEHLKVLRRKITERGLAGPDVRLSDEVAVRLLIEHGVVAAGDLRLLTDPAWCSRQEDLWWTRELSGRALSGRALPGRALLRRWLALPLSLALPGRRLWRGRLRWHLAGRVDPERGGNAVHASSADHAVVGADRDRPGEEVVPLVDRVVKGAGLVSGELAGRGVRAGQAEAHLRVGREADAAHHVDRAVVTPGLAHAQRR
jgi:hypothetical protein